MDFSIIILYYYTKMYTLTETSIVYTIIVVYGQIIIYRYGEQVLYAQRY